LAVRAPLWTLEAPDMLTPLTTDTIALADGAGQGTNAFAPDPDRWNTSTDMSVHFAQDAAIDGDALVFRIGPTTVYRYAQMGAANHEPPARYELGAIARTGSDTWLTRLPGSGAGVVHIDPARASLQRLTGLDGIEFTGVYDGLAFVAARDRAVVFDPLHPVDAAVSHFACTTVTRAFRGDGARRRLQRTRTAARRAGNSGNCVCEGCSDAASDTDADPPLVRRNDRRAPVADEVHDNAGGRSGCGRCRLVAGHLKHRSIEASKRRPISPTTRWAA
jgi:hypothetical protein